jgi:hypothetical protein
VKPGGHDDGICITGELFRPLVQVNRFLRAQLLTESATPIFKVKAGSLFNGIKGDVVLGIAPYNRARCRALFKTNAAIGTSLGINIERPLREDIREGSVAVDPS